ncbi:hypothetical protein [Pseudomonas sp. PSPC3-3]|uniref:hypothetical protein n=1 Tax=unclassified Pseudomonas TaxID=196821 RepID=UPI003CEC7D6C
MSFFLAYTLVMSIGTFVVLGLMLFAKRTKLDELESYFSENAEVRKRKQLWGPNLRFGGFHRMGLMIDILLMSKRYVKEGLVTEEELACVPLSLKRWAVWPYCLAMILAISWGYWCSWL